MRQSSCPRSDGMIYGSLSKRFADTLTTKYSSCWHERCRLPFPQSSSQVIHNSYDWKCMITRTDVYSSHRINDLHPSLSIISLSGSFLLLTPLGRAINKPQPRHRKRPLLIAQRNLCFPWNPSGFLLFRPLFSYRLNPRFLSSVADLQ